MTVKQLEEYSYLKVRARRLPDEIEKLKGEWTICGAVLTSGKSEPYHLREIIIGDLGTTKEAQLRILEKQSELESALVSTKEIERYIENINDVRLREIMTFRYIYGETWAEVARHFGYHESAESARSTVRRHFKKSFRKTEKTAITDFSPL